MKLALLVIVSAWIQGLALRGSDLESSDLVCENVGELMTEKLVVIVLTVYLILITACKMTIRVAACAVT